MDHFINRKKVPTKNSNKLKKFLNSCISRSFEEVSLNSFLQFISLKHKIPLKVVTKAPKLQTGYVLLPPLRKRQTSARSASTRSTPAAYHPWDRPSTHKTRSSRKTRRPNSGSLSTLPTFLSRGTIASRRDLRRENSCCQKRTLPLPWAKTNGKYSRCREIWPG